MAGRVARILGALTSGGWLLFGLLSAIVLRAKVETGLVPMLLPGVALALGVAVAWIWPIPGAILLFIDGLAVLAHPTVRHDPTLITLFTVPVCLSAILFLAQRRAPRRRSTVRQHVWPAEPGRR